MAATLIFKYFPDLTSEQQEQFAKLGALYHDWNEKINVISRKDIDELYERHVLHSLSIAKFTTFLPDTTILDVGTGGGFPGIPLAILFPKVQFHLVDSVGKKIKVVQEIATAIGLTNLTVEHNRMEKLKGPYDFVVSRAVAPTKQLYQWTQQCISNSSKNELSNGWILLKGGDLKSEMKEAKLPYQMIAVSDFFGESFFETKQVIYIAK